MKRFVILLSLGAVLIVPSFVFADHNTGHSIQQLQVKIQALQAQLDTLKDSTKVSSPVPSPAFPLPTVTPTAGSGSATVGVGQAVGSTFLPTPIFDDDTSDDDIVQLNHLRIQGISLPTLPTVITATYDIGVGCRKFEGLGSARGAEFPCPLAPTLLYSIRVDTDTKLLLRNRSRATLADFSVGDRINVFGFMDRDTRLIDALIVRNLDKPAVKKFIQLNNVETLSSPNAPAPPASFEVIKSHQLPCFDFGETGKESGGSFPCPLGLEVEAQSPHTKPESLLYPQPRKYTIEVTTKTQIFNRHFEVMPLADISVGDKLNIYGLQPSHNSSVIEAFTIRDLSKPPKIEREKTIQVTSPFSGEKWQIGTAQKIQWKNTTGRNVRIELNSSQPGGVYFHYVIAGPLGASVNSYTWTVPNETPGVNYIIRVTSLDTSGAADYKFFSDAPFSIVEAIPPLTIASPNGGEVWQIGSEQRIRSNLPFQDIPLSAWFEITITKGSAGPAQNITNGFLPMSSYGFADYPWVIPTSFVPGNDYRVHLYVYSDSFGSKLLASDSSDADFSIVTSGVNLPPVISGVKGPTALKVGEIGTWTISASDPENGPLSYSVIWGDEDGGGISTSTTIPLSTIPVQQTTTFTHSYAKAGIYTPTFTVTDTQSLSAKTSISVNVRDVTSVPSITILSPNGGEYWKLGSEQTIRWRSSNVPADHRIITVRLRSTVTNQEYILLNNTLNDGIERIVVPPTLTQDSYLLEIKTIVDDQTIFDQSDNYFKIIADAPSITVIFPNGGEVLEVGKIYNIRWFSNNGTLTRFTLLSKDGTTSYDTKTGNLPFESVNDGIEPWTVSNVVPGKYRLRIYCPGVDLPDQNTGNCEFKYNKFFDDSDAPFSIVSTQSFYPGFNMTLDKSTYASHDTLVLTSSRADGKADPYPVDIYAVRSKDNARILIQAGASIAVNTKTLIYLDRWGIFNEGGAGEYLILFCDASKECVGGVNTNSVLFNIVDPSVTQPVFQKISIPSTTLFTGSNIVYRFSATAGPDGEKTIKTLEFPYNASNLTFSDFKVGVYADSNFSQGIPVPSSTVKDDGKLIWNSTVVIPAGTKRYFELRLQITNQTSSSVLSIALSGQTYNTLTGSGSTAMIDTPKYELANALEAIRVELDQISKIINGLR